MAGLTFVEVASGTVIACDGESLTVDDRHCVQKGDIIFVTPATFAAIDSRLPDGQGAATAGR